MPGNFPVRVLCIESSSSGGRRQQQQAEVVVASTVTEAVKKETQEEAAHGVAQQVTVWQAGLLEAVVQSGAAARKEARKVEVKEKENG